MTRIVPALALLLLAVPTWAQEVERDVERRIIIDGEEVERADDASGEVRLRIRRGEGDADVHVLRFGGPDGGFPIPLDGLADMDLEGLGDGMRSLFLAPGLRGASPETRERVRDLERQAREHARAARDGDAGAEADLDRVLGELFEARGEARRESAAALRERAREMTERAAEMEAAAETRERDRARLIEKRKGDLLGRPRADW